MDVNGLPLLIALHSTPIYGNHEEDNVSILHVRTLAYLLNFIITAFGVFSFPNILQLDKKYKANNERTYRVFPLKLMNRT